MKIVIAGGSGQVGQLLARDFASQGNEVVVLSRRHDAAALWRTVRWDAVTVGNWAGEIDGADVVVNLAGRNVNCRYTEANRKLILESRIQSVAAIGQAIGRAQRPPSLWLQASTATIYAHRFEAGNDEYTGLIGGGETDAPRKWDYSVQVARAWEERARQANRSGTRQVLLRTSMVMSPDRGGIFDVLLRIVRWGLGGNAHHGRQYVSWIHDHDFVKAIHWIVGHPDIAGVVNVTSPTPVPYSEFMGALRRAWGMPIGLPATTWMLEIGAWLAGTETELVLKSRRVVPRRLVDSGYQYEHPMWSEAATDLVRRWRAASRRSSG